VKYIDLFAGIGGFHCALDQFEDAECVFSSEINEEAATVYLENFPDSNLHGDIQLLETKKAIPSFDLLCAGFPCQPFSKSGNLKGFDDTRGTLFFDILEILITHRPKYVLLENVANLASHDNGNTYKRIKESLVDLGYSIPNEPFIVSPHQFGIPVLRPRVYIPAVLGERISLKFDIPSIDKNSLNALTYFDFRPNESLAIPLNQVTILKIWNSFYQGIDQKILGFPIWYDSLNNDVWQPTRYRWKDEFIRKNKELYRRNKIFIDKWKSEFPEIKDYPVSFRKFEWQCGLSCQSVFDGFIQFRPSGVRVKRPTVFSTQVAINQGQIVGKYLRRLSPNEAKKLQAFPDNFILHSDEKVAFKHLGNSVNVDVVKHLLAQLFQH